MTTARRLLVSAIVLGALTVPAVAIGHSSAGAWRTLPPAPKPPTEGLSSVWTGKELLLFGRVVRRAADGAVLGRVETAAAYNPTTRTWRRLPRPLPTTGFADTHAAWTGSEMLVWGQGTREAFNLRTDRWRRLPASKLLSVHDGFALVVWTGHELIGWGGGCCGDAFSDGVAYDPAANRWRAVARSPLAGAQQPIGAWTGHELVALVGDTDPDGKRWPARLARAATYNPATNTWRRIARLPDPRPGARAIWDGHELLVVGGATGRPGAQLATVGFAYDPVANRWRRLAPMPGGRTSFAAVWTGNRLLLWGGASGAGDPPTIAPNGLAYDPKTNVWSTLPPAPLLGRFDPVASWTGRAVIVWGGQRPKAPAGTGTRYFTDGAAFTP